MCKLKWKRIIYILNGVCARPNKAFVQSHSHFFFLCRSVSLLFILYHCNWWVCNIFVCCKCTLAITNVDLVVVLFVSWIVHLILFLTLPIRITFGQVCASIGQKVNIEQYKFSNKAASECVHSVYCALPEFLMYSKSINHTVQRY